MQTGCSCLSGHQSKRLSGVSNSSIYMNEFKNNNSPHTVVMKPEKIHRCQNCFLYFTLYLCHTTGHFHMWVCGDWLPFGAVHELPFLALPHWLHFSSFGTGISYFDQFFLLYVESPSHASEWKLNALRMGNKGKARAKNKCPNSMWSVWETCNFCNLRS